MQCNDGIMPYSVEECEAKVRSSERSVRYAEQCLTEAKAVFYHWVAELEKARARAKMASLPELPRS
jgi:hypothetical protein